MAQPDERDEAGVAHAEHDPCLLQGDFASGCSNVERWDGICRIMQRWSVAAAAAAAAACRRDFPAG